MVSTLVVPVIDVQNENFKELWPSMVLAIKTASFVALDTELSGLGNRKSLLAECIEERYKAICHAARTRSILSLGIACYKKLDDKAADSYLVQVFNLTLLISEDYIIEPQSVQFLVQHGFDFNKQYAHGIPYLKGNNREGLDGRGVHIRALFTELLRARKPLVLHNGLIDMAFLYQGFYAHLPERLVTFTADLSEMFPAGIYDTKYICEFELRLTASYLEYAYKKCKLDNSRSGPHVYVEFCEYGGHMSSYVDFRECPDVSSAEGQTDVCQRFSAFGWCPNGAQCPLSHDTDLIVLQDEKGSGDKKKKKKRNKAKKRARGDVDSSVNDGAPEQKVPHVEVNPPKTPEKKQEVAPKKETLMDVADVKLKNEGNGSCEEKKDVKVPVAVAVTVAKEAGNDKIKVEDGGGEMMGELTPKKNNVDTGTHRAGFDAFMTGYIFACSCTLKKDGAVEVKQQEMEEEQKEEKKEEEEPSWLPACLNKIYLSGKAAPLNVVKSTFSKSSKAHVSKMEMVWGKKV